MARSGEGLRDFLRRPLPLPYHPLFRFYEGGALTRSFRGLPERPDDWWSEDWVGSCTCAGNADPDGRVQGLSMVELPGAGPVTLRSVVEAWPAEMLGSGCLGAETGVLVKLLSPSGPVPLHAHPTRDWARRHLGSAFGKTEAWILLDTPGDGREPAYAGIGFVPGCDREWFSAAVRRHDNASLRGSLHRFLVNPGEVYVAHAGVPHFLGPRISFIEVQEPSDHIVIAETSGSGSGSGSDSEVAAATMGLGWDVALDMIDYRTASAEETLARARQQPRVLRTRPGSRSREVRLFHDDVLPFFDASMLEVDDELEVGDGRFSIAIVVAGEGWVSGDFGREPVRRGQSFVWPASLVLRVHAGASPVRIVRCLGPAGPVGGGGQPAGSDDQSVGASGQPGASDGQEVAG
jgi:mannose-6-phosphate isomerase